MTEQKKLFCVLCGSRHSFQSECVKTETAKEEHDRRIKQGRLSRYHYRNILQMEIHASGSYGPVATEMRGLMADGVTPEKLTCTFRYGLQHPYKWKLNGYPITRLQVVFWFRQTPMEC